MLVMSLIRDLEFLSYVSLAGLLIQILSIVIIFQYIGRDFLSWENLRLVEPDITRYPIFLSTLVFAFEGIFWDLIISRGHATLELAVSVGRSVRNITFLFFAPAHQSATGGGVYTALFMIVDTIRNVDSSSLNKKPILICFRLV